MEDRRLKPLTLILIVLITLPLSAQEQAKPSGSDRLFDAMRVNYMVMGWTDYAITTIGLDEGCTEANPIARLYIEKPALCVSLLVIDNVFMGWATGELYRRNKTWGWVAVAVLTIVKAWVLYNNVREVRK